MSPFTINAIPVPAEQNAIDSSTIAEVSMLPEEMPNRYERSLAAAHTGDGRLVRFCVAVTQGCLRNTIKYYNTKGDYYEEIIKEK